jgi:hypothetical protein
MLDKLIMLLSTDWFEPHWSEIGIRVDEPTKSCVQQGSRQIVTEILSGANSYDQVSFSAERLAVTRSMFSSLIREAGAESALSAGERWDTMSDEELKAAWIYTSLTDDLLSGNIQDADPKLASNILQVVRESQQHYGLAEYEFIDKCESSETKWDRFIRQLTPEQPSALADDLSAFLTAIRFETFWRSIRIKLTPAQMKVLVVWYREMAKAKGRRDITPSYVHE